MCHSVTLSHYVCYRHVTIENEDRRVKSPPDQYFSYETNTWNEHDNDRINRYGFNGFDLD
jgi:hypothetical protein